MPLGGSRFCENWCNDSHALYRGANEILPYFLQLDLYTIEHSRYPPQFTEFRENWRSESHTLLTGVGEFPSVFSTFIA
jgi:hypothetical protein